MCATGAGEQPSPKRKGEPGCASLTRATRHHVARIRPKAASGVTSSPTCLERSGLYVSHWQRRIILSEGKGEPGCASLTRATGSYRDTTPGPAARAAAPPRCPRPRTHPVRPAPAAAMAWLQPFPPVLPPTAATASTRAADTPAAPSPHATTGAADTRDTRALPAPPPAPPAARTPRGTTRYARPLAPGSPAVPVRCIRPGRHAVPAPGRARHGWTRPPPASPLPGRRTRTSADAAPRSVPADRRRTRSCSGPPRRTGTHRRSSVRRWPPAPHPGPGRPLPCRGHVACSRRPIPRRAGALPRNRSGRGRLGLHRAHPPRIPSALRHRPRAEHHAHARRHRTRGLGDAVLVGGLAGVAHHQQAARLQVDADGTATGLGADVHAPGAAQRDQRQRLAGDELVQLVVVHGHAVVAVAVEVQACAGVAAWRHRLHAFQHRR